MRDESSGGVGHDSSFDTTVARDERIVVPREAEKHRRSVVHSPNRQTSRSPHCLCHRRWTTLEAKLKAFRYVLEQH